MNNALETRYFLSAMTGAGYYALHRQFLRPPERYFCILKGGPGCGKSTFLRRVGDAGRAAGLSVVWLHCAGDPASLDGVYFPQKHAGFFDGTAPHTVEPALFGASGEYLALILSISHWLSDSTLTNSARRSDRPKQADTFEE